MEASQTDGNKRLLSSDQTDMLTRLTDELRRLNRHRYIQIHNSLWRLVMFQFLRGLAFGLGSVIGATILFSILAWWLSQFEFLPVIGEWVGRLADQIDQARGP